TTAVSICDHAAATPVVSSATQAAAAMKTRNGLRARRGARCRLAVCKSSRAASAAAAPAGFGARSAPQAATPFGLAFGKIGRPAAPGYPIRPGLLLLSGPFI